MSGWLERRGAPRVPITLLVEYAQAESFLSDYTKNISRGGMFVETRNPVELGTKFEFRIHVGSLAEPLRLKGEVVRCVDPQSADQAGESPGIGIRFVFLDDQERAAFENAVGRILAGGAAD